MTATPNLNFQLERASNLKAKPAESELGFGRFFTDHLLRMDFTRKGGWSDPRIVPYGPLGIDPAASVLHYAQEVFDGAKIFRGEDGKLRSFRMKEHAQRLVRSAERLCMESPDADTIVACITELARVDRDWVPSGRGTALYVRPTIIASEAFLGVRPANEYIFFIILSPVGSYYAEGQKPVKIWVEETQVRAAPGGLGEAKAGANYAASIKAAEDAKARGFTQVLWLDALEHQWLEEVGTMNLFLRIGDEVVTPPLEGTLLPGVTRLSVIELLRKRGVKVTERRINIKEVRQAHADGTLKEIFGSGTAAIISPVGTLGFRDGNLTVGNGEPGEMSRTLYEEIVAIQRGESPDPFGWMTEIG